MKVPSLRLFAAVFALMFVAAACAGDTGAEWTFAPVAIASTTDSGDATDESVTDVEAGDADPDELPPADADAETEPGTDTETGGAPSDGPRVIQVLADGALQFTDTDGTKITDIAVTPGETVVFQVANTAGFAHNFYIGEDAELSVPSATTDTGIADFSTGVEELEWTVPESVDGLKFGCTVPGHYTLMQGTFSVSDAPAEPTEPVDPAESMAPTESAAPDTGSVTAADARVIDIEATAALQFAQNGEQIRDIPVTPGEFVVFRIDNTAGFSHNFYIGTDEELTAPGATTDVGSPDWNEGVQFVEWEVPADVTGLKFGCTVPGHYTLMQGTLSVSP